MKNKISCASCNIFCKDFKNGIEILVRQAGFKLWIKTVKILFEYISQKPLCYFLSSLSNSLLDANISNQKDVDIFEIEQKNHANLGVGGAVPH